MSCEAVGWKDDGGGVERAQRAAPVGKHRSLMLMATLLFAAFTESSSQKLCGVGGGGGRGGGSPAEVDVISSCRHSAGNHISCQEPRGGAGEEVLCNRRSDVAIVTLT